ncbi:methyltransferase family protein [Candidatus Uabimicrobium amorphum]|uniref:Membrane protein n=1 Tax=Uabimicrobium amorphum TaxID=2596890 RepID=A0A5S9IN07_UABAM|nr:isoprenylcysteine carboxylmethyltransferase family protein [Candidatus Uabimicrobium amorphum]BBM84527.1 membrane protein [Candidatus Uabimicrobium amorphum]
MNKKSLLLKILVRMVLSVVVFGLMLFWPAGTFSYTAGWIYLGVVYSFMLVMTSYFFKHDPALLERRMQMKEKEAEQKLLIKLASLIYLCGFFLPGFDYRYGWSEVPMELIIAANAVVMVGLIIVFWVFKANSYAARTIEVFDGQELVSTGPYAIVRHPMYTGVQLMLLATPIALGSYWMLIPFALSPLFFYFRIKNEEKVLCEQLDGYLQYREEVRYRMFPYIW